MNFRDLIVFDSRPDFQKLPHGQLDDVKFESDGYGIAIPWRQSGNLRRTGTLPVWLEGLDVIGAFRRFVEVRRGRQQTFWLPIYLNDFGIVADCAAGASTITLTGTIFATRWALGGQFKFISIITSAKLECYGVTGVTISGGNSILTLSRGLDTAIVSISTICCALLIVRFKDDKVDFDYQNGAFAVANIQFVECPKEYPAPEASSSALDFVHIGTRPVFLFRITDGVSTYYFAEYGVDVVAASQTWKAASMKFDNIKSSYEMLGDQLNVTITTDDSAHPMRDYLNELNMRNFTADLFIADMDNLGILDLSAPDHLGRIENVEFDPEGKIAINVSSAFRSNEAMLPTIRLQRTCSLRTFVGQCQAVEADFTTTATVSAINTDPAWIEATAFGAKATTESDPDWFALGKVVVGTEIRLCTGQSGNRLYLNFPFRLAVVGNACSAVAGDNKRVTTCDTKFGQLAVHMGWPYIPNTNPSLQPLKQPVQTGGKK